MAFDFTRKPKTGTGFNFNKAPDPLKDVEYSGDLEADSAKELTAMQKAYRDRAKQESKRFQNATDSEYWFAVCFKTREHKERFLEAAKMLHMGDKYIDGHALAKMIGIDIESD